MNKNISRFTIFLKKELRLIIAISLGIFLFILFLQPFPYGFTDFNNSLVFIAGLGAIVFLVMILVRTVFLAAGPAILDEDLQVLVPSFLQGFLIFVFSSVAFAFYLRYVGEIDITYYIALKVVVICIAAPLALRLYTFYKRLMIQNKILQDEKENLHGQFEAYQKETMNKTIEFATDNIRENLVLLPKDLVCIKSADNYVEIIYKEEEQLNKKLIRNTMRNIEQMLKPWSVFIRCHRTCLINTLLVQNLYKRRNNHHIVMKGYNEELPVSRQYLFRLRESLDKGQGRIKFTQPV